MYQEIILIFLAMAPVFELRASIPYGLSVGMNIYVVLILSLLANLLGAIIAHFVINHVIPWLRKIKLVDKLYVKWVERTRKRVEKKIQKYGVLGLAIFIGLPIPGSGVWTGALAANLLNIKFRNFFKASLLGIILAGTVVTALTLAGLEAWHYG